jgi:uncharacterized protein (TIGR02271 family)
MLRDRTQLSTVIVGVFAYASDARRALNTFLEYQFPSSEIEAAFRVPPSNKETDQAAGKWFGQLRQIYRANDLKPPTAPTSVESDLGLTAAEPLLAHMDLSERDEEALKRDLDRGGAVVAVRSGARNAEAQTLLEQLGARTFHAQSSAPLPTQIESDPVTVTSAPFAPPQAAAPGHLQLFGEVLRVHKEKVSNGNVQVRKEAVTEMETVEVPITREHLVVEQNANGGENPIRIPLSEERVRIDKDTVLREEYQVGKREVTQMETVGDTVRRERLLVDDPTAHS